MKRKVTSLILSVVLMFSMFLTGCNKKTANTVPNESAQNNKNTKQTAETEPFTLPLTKEKKTLVWAARDSWYAPASYNSGLETWKQIEERTNVHIQWDVTATEYSNKMKLRLAAGKDLPDMLSVPGDVSSYGKSGLIIPMEELIAKYAPNIQKVWKTYPGAREIVTNADGHIYSLAAIIADGNKGNPYGWVIRKDWLDKLGLKEPETTDDWLKVFKAFKEQDPNGNGKQDEIPLCDDPTIFGEAFGVELYMDSSDFVVENGKVIYKWAHPNMPKYLEFANTLYKNGYLDPNYAATNADSEDQETKVAKNLVGAYVNYPDWAVAWQQTLQKAGVREARYIPIRPAKGPDGYQSLGIPAVTYQGGTAISRDCKDPVLAIKMLDYMWSEEGIRYMAWGVEGKTYTIVNGKPKLTDFVLKNPDGLGASDALRTVGAWPTIPWVQQMDLYKDLVASYPDFKDISTYLDPVYKECYPGLKGTKEEEERIAAIATDMKTYREEMILKFTTGKEPISNFPKFVEQLKAMGLDEYVKIEQIKYDRFKSLMEKNK